MPWTTLFSCDSVEFSSSEGLPVVSPDALQSGTSDHWSSAKVSVQDLGSNDRWLMIELDSAPPKVFRAIKKDWKISADERTMTVTMQGAEPGVLTKTTQKLRFERANREDFWRFLHQVAMSRVHELFPRQ